HPGHGDGPPPFSPKGRYSVHAIEKIDSRFVFQNYHGIRQNLAPESLAEGENANVIPLRQIDPEVRIQGRDRRPLEHRRSHSRDLEADPFFGKRAEEASKRTKRTFISHRSSGVAARLRAKSRLSCS